MSILDILSQKLMISKYELSSFIRTAPYRYKVYAIPKRNNNGVRIIAQPTDVLKSMQKMALEGFLSNLPVHNCATAYRNGISIKDNATAHINNEYLLKMDFNDFFPSIEAIDLIKHITKFYGNIDKEDAYISEMLFFWTQKKDPKRLRRLSIGAPSSPFISNTILYDFDCIISDKCAEIGVTYTRYADDMTFTTNEKNILSDIPTLVSDTCKKIEYPRLTINSKKTIFASKKSNRHVTGIVLTNDNKLSLGHAQKRYLRSMIYKFTKNEMSPDEIVSLRGLLTHAKHIEPAFYYAATQKYGFPILDAIMRFQPQPK